MVLMKEFCLLRRCPGLPSLSEIKRTYEELVIKYGAGVIEKQLLTLFDSTIAQTHKRQAILFFLDGHRANYVAKLEGVTRLSVRRSLAKSMRDLLVAVEKTEETSTSRSLVRAASA